MWQSSTGDFLRGEIPDVHDQYGTLDWLYPVAVEAHVLDDDEERLAPLDASFSWSPKLETRADAEARIRKALATHLRDNLDRIQDLAIERGMHRVTVLAPDQFEWLAYYQVGTKPDGTQWAQSDLAKKFRKNRVTIREALRVRAELIGLTLRAPGRPGRRTKRHARTYRVTRTKPA
jgi:hypothetical protein